MCTGAFGSYHMIHLFYFHQKHKSSHITAVKTEFQWFCLMPITPGALVFFVIVIIFEIVIELQDFSLPLLPLKPSHIPLTAVLQINGLFVSTLL